MHNHDDNDTGTKSMLWMMAICCGLPVVLLLIFGGGGSALGASPWAIIGIVGVMVGTHLFMMRKSHRHSDEPHVTTDEEERSKDDGNGTTRSGHGCCR